MLGLGTYARGKALFWIMLVFSVLLMGFAGHSRCMVMVKNQVATLVLLICWCVSWLLDRFMLVGGYVFFALVLNLS